MRGDVVAEVVVDVAISSMLTLSAVSARRTGESLTNFLHMNDKTRVWSIKELYRRLVLGLFGKKRVTATDLGRLIANDVLAHLGRSPTPIGPLDPVFSRLPPEDRKRFVVESSVAHVMFFAHFFMNSCDDPDFAARTFQCFAGLIALRMSENDDIQMILGLGERRPARQTFDELAEAFYERGNFYLSILGTCAGADYTAFARACNDALGLRPQDDGGGYARSSTETWDTLAVAYGRTLVRIWENMTPG